MKIHSPPRIRGARSRAFTLIELLVVIAIIAILAALTMGTFSFAQQSAARNRTIAGLQAIVGALEQYKEKFGEYPEPSNAGEQDPNSTSSLRIGGAHMLYQAITGDGKSAIRLATADSEESDGTVSSTERDNSISGSLPAALIYPPPSMRSPGSSYPRWLVDGFGKPFQYDKGGTPDAVNSTFDVWSFGPLDAAVASDSYSLSRKKDEQATKVWIKNW
jgi:prepilin-type N-terminal cleavage/methylation domain-containing protein